MGLAPVGRQVHWPETTQRNWGAHSPHIRLFGNLRPHAGAMSPRVEEATMDQMFVGIDIAKLSFEVAVRGVAGDSRWGTFANSPAGFEEWRARLSALLAAQPAQGVVVAEPTGGVGLGVGR